MARNLTNAARPLVVDRVIYTTITLMSVLILYDGWHQLSFIALTGVIVGPVLAIFLSHVFSASLAHQVALGRSVTMRERMKIARTEAPFLLFCLPPLVLIGVLRLLGVELSDAIHWVVAVGMLSLGYWGGVAGRRAGMTGWRLASSVLAGLLIGAVILALQVFLQPGKIGS